MADETLTPLQRAALELFFALPESEGFVLAGGAALVAVGLSTRPTKDIDLFGADLEHGIAPAANALEAACVARGWLIERIRDNPTFRRLTIRRGDEDLLVDLAIDSPPLGMPTITGVGPTYPTASARSNNARILRLPHTCGSRTTSSSRWVPTPAGYVPSPISGVPS